MRLYGHKLTVLLRASVKTQENTNLTNQDEALIGTIPKGVLQVWFAF